ncbi:uncharacterized protein MELLADRAFT_111875 [Melampsora larici-populina 98AG31]|uniref:Uncharacterized protein n=1 Tax=Melampsora larici-populina (strain 98AG31 / pathotype 3-4-7) TaxID=747676 RepID=F4S4N2_MELLP|nr:uncharacterized protein MELLADRAFT_111875 [Melampsora larici-populina 98AG31]EGG00397.1 hypothetical protein MELLADRAFT_111875 [Melampsora larici-populina 98AG31]
MPLTRSKKTTKVATKKKSNRTKKNTSKSTRTDRDTSSSEGSDTHGNPDADDQDGLRNQDDSAPGPTQSKAKNGMGSKTVKANPWIRSDAVIWVWLKDIKNNLFVIEAKPNDNSQINPTEQDGTQPQTSSMPIQSKQKKKKTTDQQQTRDVTRKRPKLGAGPSSHRHVQKQNSREGSTTTLEEEEDLDYQNKQHDSDDSDDSNDLDNVGTISPLCIYL